MYLSNIFAEEADHASNMATFKESVAPIVPSGVATWRFQCKLKNLVFNSMVTNMVYGLLGPEKAVWKK